MGWRVGLFLLVQILSLEMLYYRAALAHEELDEDFATLQIDYRTGMGT